MWLRPDHDRFGLVLLFGGGVLCTVGAVVLAVSRVRSVFEARIDRAS